MGVLKVMYSDIKMELLRSWRYKFAVFSDLIVFTLLFAFFIYTGTGQSFAEKYSVADSRPLLLTGYLLWTIASTAVGTMSSFFVSEAAQGTLPLILHSIYPLEFILFARYISEQIIHFFTLLVLVLFSNLFWGIKLIVNVHIVIPLILCVLGMFGVGLFLAGLSVLFKRVGSLVFLIQLSFLFITDTIPTMDALLVFTRVIPLTQCNDLGRKIVAGLSYSGKELFLLIMTCLVWLLVGVICFRFLLSRSKKKGNLMFY